MPDNQETELLKRAVAGDTDAFADLVDRYAGRLYGVCFSILGNHADAQDCVQEAFLKAFRTMQRFHFGSSFYTWIYRIAANTCYDLLRHNQRRPTDSLDEPTTSQDGDQYRQFSDQGLLPDDLLVQKETVHLVRRALARLPENLQRLIILRDLEGLSYENIAEMENLRPGTVKSRLFRARVALADQLRLMEQISGQHV